MSDYYTDNTNADPNTRAHWVNLAKKMNVPIRCVLFTASPQLCEHNDAVRALNAGPEVGPSPHMSRIMLSVTSRLIVEAMHCDIRRSVFTEDICNCKKCWEVAKCVQR